MRMIPIHSAKRQSSRTSRTKFSHAGAVAAMVVLTVGLAALGSAASSVAQDAEMAKVDYPTGYRDWTHVKSMVIQPGHQLYESFGGIHHIYANQSALEGYRTGSFADGSVIIFDLLEAPRPTTRSPRANARCSALCKRTASGLPEPAAGALKASPQATQPGRWSARMPQPLASDVTRRRRTTTTSSASGVSDQQQRSS